MRYLKRYESAGFDADFAVAKIRNRYSEEEVASMLAKEIGEWADEDFYSENGNGEAEEVVLCGLISWFEKEYSKELDESEEAALEDSLRQAYSCIN